METRLIVAFSVIAAVLVVALPVTMIQLRRRRADRLRRRGVKSYNRSKSTPRSIA